MLLLELLGDLLSPERCAACDEPVRRRRAFCPCCAASVEPAPFASPLGLPAPCVGAFGGALARAIHRLKYDDRPDLARPLGELMAAACEQAGVEAEVVVPIPLSPTRLRERGYNQAALLGARVARRLGLPCWPAAVERVVETGALARQDRAQRQRSVEGAFAADAALAGRRVLLIDDVLTTGATLGACLRAVEARGGLVVATCTAARVERLTPGLRWRMPHRHDPKR